MECNKCSLCIDRKNDRYTICEGKCAGRYHASCVQISEATMRALFTKNVLWMCDECLLDFCAKRDANNEECVEYTDEEIADTSSHPSAIEADVAELKTKVAEIIETLAVMTNQRTTQVQLPYEKRHSTPVLPHRNDSLFDGTKTYDDADTGGGVCLDRNESFALFLTNIEPDATEDHIERLVCTSLDIHDAEKVKVRKLVPRGRACEELDYVSFKVTLEAKWKTLALQPSTWPLRIKYREFEHRNFVWKPM